MGLFAIVVRCTWCGVRMCNPLILLVTDQRSLVTPQNGTLFASEEREAVEKVFDSVIAIERRTMENDISARFGNGMYLAAMRAGDPKSADQLEFGVRIAKYIYEGIEQNLSPRAVAEQIYPDFQQRPDLAQEVYPFIPKDFSDLQQWLDDGDGKLRDPFVAD